MNFLQVFILYFFTANVNAIIDLLIPLYPDNNLLPLSTICKHYNPPNFD